MTASTAPRLVRLTDMVYIGIAAALVLLRLFSVPPWDQSVDAYAYWRPVGPGGPYEGAELGELGSFLYSPVFKLAFIPAGWLPWPVFNAAWTALNLAILRALGGRYALILLLFLPIPFEIISGNVHLLIAATIAWGLTRPSLWTIPLLTKVTPGVGIGWHVVRREWRALAVALGATGIAVGISVLLVPHWWADWIALLQGDPLPTSTPGWYLPLSPFLRFPLAVGLVAWAGWTGRRWILPFATVLAMPVIWLNSLAVLAALVPLARDRASR
jgi:hypothetical protein